MTICLAMIAKNEAHCIEKCLNSVKPFIDYWIICGDTTTTDNTEEVVQNCLKDIPGEYHKHDWVDFATNRNMSLQLAKSKADYILVIDADDYLEVQDPTVFNKLNNPAYSIMFSHGSIQYDRIQLFSSKVEAKYVGILHEYLEIYEKTILLKGCRIIYGCRGSTSQDPAKFLKHALAFEKALVTEPNNSRYVFYCAQSYRDAGKPLEALKFYEKRSKMGGWIEEQYQSLMQIAKITEFLYPDDILKVESAYLEAYNCQPKRVESLTYLCSYCRNKNLFHQSYFFGKIGVNIFKPQSALFLEPDCYDWKIIDELAIAAYWIGKKQEAALLNNALLKSGMLPPNERSRIIKNLEFCEK